MREYKNSCFYIKFKNMRKRDLKQKSLLYCKNHKTSINDLDDFAKDFTDLDGKDFDTLLEYIRMVKEEEIKKKKT